MKTIILAGGKGTRLPESAKHIPKPLVEVAGKPILEHQIHALIAQGFPDIRLSLGHKAEVIRDWVVKRWPHVECVIEAEPRGTGGAIRYASADLLEPFLVVNGDIVSDFNFSDVASKGKETGANVILGHALPDAREMGLLEVQGDTIRAFLEKPKVERPGIINAGLYYLQPNLFHRMPDQFSIEHMIFPELARAGALRHVLHRGNYWFDCGTEERLRNVRAYLEVRSKR